MNLLKALHVISILIILNTLTFSQSISLAQLDQIDNLFAEFSDGPSIEYGIIFGDKVYTKKYSNPNDNFKVNGHDQYRLGGMSMQFAAYGILLLESQGKISLDQEISRYLGNEFPIQLEGITVTHLMNHTHGLPEYWSLKQLMGFDSYDVFGTDEASHLFTSSLEKIYKTGSEVSFSGTGSYLMARIIEKVSGQNYGDFARENIFRPLEMNHSLIVEENTGKEKNLISYTQENETFLPQTVRHYDSGPAGVITTMDDIVRWYQHINKIDNPMSIKMDQRITWEGGEFASTGNGILTFGQQFMHAERGVNKIWDYGHLGGFASAVFRFPAQELSIIILGKNGLNYNGFLGMEISDILLQGVYLPEEAPSEDIKFVALSNEISKQFIGNYFDSENFLLRSIKLRNDTLRYIRPNNNSESNLLPTADGSLVMISDYGNPILSLQNNRLKFDEGSYTINFDKLNPSSTNKSSLEIEGFYFNEDYQAVMKIYKNKNGEWLLKVNHQESPLTKVDGNRYISDNQSYNMLQVQFTNDQNINGFLVSSAGYKNVLFRKING